MNPVNWLLFLSALSLNRYVVYYLVCYGLLVASLDWMFAQQSYTWAVPSVACSTLLLLALFRIVGILIHANAESLGLPVRFGSQVEASQIAENIRREESEFCADLYRLVEADKTQEGWQRYQGFLSKADHGRFDRLWPVISQWPNPALALLAGQTQIEQLVKDENYPRAWQILAHCFERNHQEFKLLTARSTLELALRCENNQQKHIGAELLKFFGKDFPKHPRCAEASLKAVELMLEENNLEAAKRLLQQIRIKYPEVRGQETFKRLSLLVN